MSCFVIIWFGLSLTMLRWLGVNCAIAPVPMGQPWFIWGNIEYESIKNAATENRKKNPGSRTPILTSSSKYFHLCVDIQLPLYNDSIVIHNSYCTMLIMVMGLIGMHMKFPYHSQRPNIKCVFYIHKCWSNARVTNLYNEILACVR